MGDLRCQQLFQPVSAFNGVKDMARAYLYFSENQLLNGSVLKKFTSSKN